MWEEGEHPHLIVGNVCLDMVPGTGVSVGGTSYFAAACARDLGCDVTVHTACTDRTSEVVRSHLGPDVALICRSTIEDTRFEFAADSPTRLAANAGAIEDLDLGHLFRSAHIGPIAGEVPLTTAMRVRDRADFVGITLQGFMRTFGPNGEVSLGGLGDGRVLALADAIVVNTAEYMSLAEGESVEHESLPMVFVTDGGDGARLVCNGREVARSRPTVGAVGVSSPRHTIGAGDVFASTAFVLLARGLPARTALQLAVDAATSFVMSRVASSW